MAWVGVPFDAVFELAEHGDDLGAGVVVLLGGGGGCDEGDLCWESLEDAEDMSVHELGGFVEGVDLVADLGLEGGDGVVPVGEGVDIDVEGVVDGLGDGACEGVDVEGVAHGGVDGGEDGEHLLLEESADVGLDGVDLGGVPGFHAVHELEESVVFVGICAFTACRAACCRRACR